MKALILYARDNEWVDSKTGELRRFVSVNYLENMPSMKEGKEKGVAALTMDAKDDALTVILAKDLPAIFDIEIGRTAGPKGKPSSVITKAKFVEPWKLDTFLG
jgi:hypothetical protein